jgi:hypothetical protein
MLKDFTYRWNGSPMKRSVNKNKPDILDWWLSIDFDPAQLPRMRCDWLITHAFLLDEKKVELRRGD